MTSTLIQTLTAITDRVIALAGEDESFRKHLRALAEAVLAVTTGDGSSKLAEAISEVIVPIPQIEALLVVPAAEPRPEQQVILRTIAVPEAPEPAAAVSSVSAIAVPEVSDADLPLIEQRLRLKAEGVRWAATRRRRLAEGTDFDTEIDPVDREIIEKAKRLPDCFLWMNHPTGPSPSNTVLLDDLAGCFDVTADVVNLVRGILNDPDAKGGSMEDALELLAESQSALRAAVERVGFGQDKDQGRVYHWLRGTCWRTQFFINRYMKIDDMADSTSWADIGGRIEKLDSQYQQDRRRSKQHQSAINRIRYHLKPVMEGRPGDRQHDWDIIIETVDEMVRDGVPPSSTALRELLLPAVDLIPNVELPQGLLLVVREIDRFLGSRSSSSVEVATPEPTADVKAVATLLKNKGMVLIGGARRPQAHEALRTAFGLKELDWVETKEHESVTVFESHIARPDVALVILAIRWSSHAFGDVRQYCEKYGKPLVRLPAGYNPNQVAAQVVAQCGDRLAGE